MDTVVRVHMLGTLTITVGDQRIDDTQNRSKKLWALLAYLLCHHGRVVSQSELIDLLWSEDKEGANPTSALKTTLHRLRAMLDQLMPGGGHTLIVNRSGGYCWPDEIPLWLDAEEFDHLCRVKSGTGSDAELAQLKQALGLYRGGFLSKLSGESWVIPQNAYYHNQYLQAVGRVLELMETHGSWAESEAICRAALKLDPYREDLYQHLMRNLLAMGRQEDAAATYEDMSKLLLANFGVMPDQESRRLYRDALRTVNKRSVPVGVIQEQLREVSPLAGALVCDYDFFKMIYQAEARMVDRSGNAVHIAVLTLGGGRSKELAQRSLELAMDNMEELARLNLRKGDVISRCSPSQFVLMLPQANFENSGMVCQRIMRAFGRKYPHSPAQMEYTIYPIEPAADIKI